MKWLTDEWKVSPWNFYENSLKDLHFPEKVIIHDTTLRDGEQASGVQFSYQEKYAIAKKLVEAGVDRIEVCMPVVSKEDQKVLSDLAKEAHGGSKLYVLSRANPRDVALAADCGAEGAAVEIPASREVIASYGWTVQETADRCVEAMRIAKERGMATNLFLMDGTRGELSELIELIGLVKAACTFDSITLVDTLGVLHPGAVRMAMAALTDNFLGIPLEIHCHNDYGMAIANTVTALSMGARVAHTTVLGLGDRAGGAPLEELVMALHALYAVPTNIDNHQLRELAELVSRCTGVPLPPNKAVVGSNIFTTESGIPAMIIRKNQEAGRPDRDVWPFAPTASGFPGSKLVLGKFSGDYSVKAYLDDMRISLPESQVSALTNAVKARSIETGRLLTLNDFRELLLAL